MLLVFVYSKVSYRWGLWNSRGDWKKYKKLIAGAVGVVEEVEKKLKILIAGGGLAFNLLSSFLL